MKTFAAMSLLVAVSATAQVDLSSGTTLTLMPLVRQANLLHCGEYIALRKGTSSLLIRGEEKPGQMSRPSCCASFPLFGSTSTRPQVRPLRCWLPAKQACQTSCSA